MIKGKRKTVVPNENDDEKQQIATETACFCTKGCVVAVKTFTLYDNEEDIFN